MRWQNMRDIRGAVFNEKGVMMALFEMVNTELQVASPLDNSLEAAFGQAALKLLEKGDRKSLEKLLDLYNQSKDLAKQLDKLLKAK